MSCFNFSWSLSCKAPYKLYVKTFPIPSSAKDNSVRIFVYRPFTPVYSAPNFLTNIVLVTKAKTSVISCCAKPNETFLTEFALLDFPILFSSYT